MYLMVSCPGGGGVEETGLLVEVDEHLVLFLQLLRSKLDYTDVRQPRILYIRVGGLNEEIF